MDSPSDPDTLHIIARLFTLTKTQVTYEAQTFKHIECIHVNWQNLNEWLSCALFDDERKSNFKFALRGRYNKPAYRAKTTGEKDGLTPFEKRVRGLPFRLFCILTPILNQKQIVSIPDYLWPFTIQFLSEHFIGVPWPKASFLEDCKRSKIFFCQATEESFQAEFEEHERAENERCREKKIVELKAAAKKKLEGATKQINTELEQAIASSVIPGCAAPSEHSRANNSVCPPSPGWPAIDDNPLPNDNDTDPSLSGQYNPQPGSRNTDQQSPEPTPKRKRDDGLEPHQPQDQILRAQAIEQAAKLAGVQGGASPQTSGYLQAPPNWYGTWANAPLAEGRPGYDLDSESTPSINPNSALLQHAPTPPSIAQHTTAPLLPSVPTEDSWQFNTFSSFHSSLPPAPTVESWELNNRFSNFNSSLPPAPNPTFGSGNWGM